MNASRALTQITAAVAAACAGVVAAGADSGRVMYLTPVKYTASVGERVAVRAELGDGNLVQRTAWPTERIDWLFVRAPGTQENRENVAPTDPKDDFINVALTQPGVTMVGLDTKPTLTNVDGKSFKAFLKRVASPELHDRRSVGVSPATIATIGDEDQVRVWRVESAKTLVRVLDPDGKAPSHSAVAQSKTGQTAEIRALADPTMVAVGSDLPVRTYVRGCKQVGVKVLATCVATGKTQEALTDLSGSCHFRISNAGVWRIEFHYSESRSVSERKSEPRSVSERNASLPDAAAADWTVYSATLTFETTRTGAGK